MRRDKKIVGFLLLLWSILIPSVPVFGEGSYYTYTYDFWMDERESPDAYVPTKAIFGDDFGIGSFREPQGLFAAGNRVYVCDSFNHRIVELAKADGEYSLIRVIDSIWVDGEESPLKYPNDIFVNDDGQLYICDTDNQRILHTDNDLRLIKMIAKPEEETIDAASDFFPMKLVVDEAGRIFVQVKNVNKGLMEFDSEGDFTGYLGANLVTVSFMDYFWKLIATKEQRAQMELFVPTEYNNVALDSNGFLYVTTSTFEEGELLHGNANPVRKLNPMGTDILIRNGYFLPIGDVQWDNAGGINGPSKFVDVTVLENDTYYALDRVRGRIFAYDFQGNLLYAFGGLGNKLGYFQYPSAIDHLEDCILVLDYRTGVLTELTLTEYGRLINEGLMEYKRGNYDLSSEKWEQVLKINGNYDLAYIGIGRALLRQGRYDEAMEYFEVKLDDRNYSKAYQLYRKEQVENYIAYLLIVILLVILIPIVGKRIRRSGKEVEPK